MAGDWIKMRSDLFTHPKVVRIASALKADTLRTVGGLMSVWCLFDAHSEDGYLDGYTPEVLDAHLRWDGFADAMMAVGWLDEKYGSGLALPRFDTHNGQSAKRRAQDADRKREIRKTSASEADKKRTREEKRREDISVTDVTDKKQARASLALPDWLPSEQWAGFVEMRKRIKAPLTDRAITLTIGELEKLRAQGQDPGAVLDQSVANGWKGVFQIKGQAQGARRMPPPDDFSKIDYGKGVSLL